MKKIFLLAALVFTSAVSHAQTLRIRCNSYENLQVGAVGVNAVGKHTSSSLYDLTHDEWFTISLMKEKFGYDQYNNSEMVHEPTDSTWRWQKLLIYNNNNVFDTIDISKPCKKVHLSQANIWAKVKVSYDRKYVITEVVLGDE